MLSSKVVSEEFVRRILKTFPLNNPFLTRGWQEVKCVSSRIDFSLESCALNHCIECKVSDISAVNLKVG